jgi:hypothetical protein
MGLVLYAVLILFGARGMPIRRAVWYCLFTAALLTLLGFGAMGEAAAGQSLSYGPLATMALVFPTTLVIALLCFGSGAAARRVLGKLRGS